MKTALIAALLLTSASAFAQVYVQPHVRSDGTAVQGHYRSNPDGNPYNNYSSRGNVNPYTGKVGTVDPNQFYSPKPAPSYTPPPVYSNPQQNHRSRSAF
jgi:hypothetical protein